MTRKPTKKRRGGPKRKVDDRALARMADLARQGQTQQAIAITLEQEGLARVGQQTVQRYLVQLEAEGERLARRTRRDVRSRAAPPCAPRAGGPGAPRDQGGATVPDVAAALATSGDLSTLRARLVEVGEMIAAARAHGNVGTYAALVKIEGDLVAKIQALTPPPAPDPATNPSYAEARRRLLARLEQIVERSTT